MKHIYINFFYCNLLNDMLSIRSLANGTSTTQNPETQLTQHLQPPPEGVPRRYSDSSVTNAGQSAQPHLAPQSGALRKLSDTTAPKSNLTTPSTDGHLHLPSPPSSPMLRHRRFKIFYYISYVVLQWSGQFYRSRFVEWSTWNVFLSSERDGKHFIILVFLVQTVRCGSSFYFSCQFMALALAHLGHKLKEKTFAVL